VSVLGIAELLNGRRPDDLPVATRGGRVLTLARLRADVAHNAEALSGIRRALLVSDDSYRFLTALLALLHVGANVVLPPNAQSGTLRLIGDSYDLLVSDVDRPEVARSFVIQSAAAEAAPFQLAAAEGRLDFFTSGSTGDMKRVEKTAALLECEAATLETLWGEVLGDARVFGTVSHQHIFGLTFKLLWPLLAGRCFCAETHGVWETLLAELSPGAVIVSSPAHLTRLGGLEPLPRRLAPRLILTAGAPLPPEAAAETQEILGTPPTEIFGSTETGAIAWRKIATGAGFWEALPGIEIGSHGEGLLRVRSPFIGGDGRSDLADRVVIGPGGRFRFEGRADRVLKIEGKRVSLQILEREIAALPWIEAVAVAPLSLPRSFLGAVAVLTPAGKEELARRGKFRFERLLRRALLSSQDAAVLPRRWRFVERMPMDGMGKRRTADIAALLADRPCT
jgi:acyl-coenzyme A synthetase/AMP-(fatty) acid ligase